MVKIISNFYRSTRSFSIYALLALVAACNEPADDTGGTRPADTSEGVITTPPHDTSNVVSPPPTNDSNVVNTDSMATSR